MIKQTFQNMKGILLVCCYIIKQVSALWKTFLKLMSQWLNLKALRKLHKAELSP